MLMLCWVLPQPQLLLVRQAIQPLLLLLPLLLRVRCQAPQSLQLVLRWAGLSLLLLLLLCWADRSL
jgi:hypothetical protein